MAKEKKFKLPKKIKDKWVQALRSGKYKQGNSRLFTEDTNSYCCLGVLARTLGKSEDQILGYGYISEDWLKEIRLKFPYSIQVKFSSFNDEKKWSFDKIASYIERYL